MHIDLQAWRAFVQASHTWIQIHIFSPGFLHLCTFQTSENPMTWVWQDGKMGDVSTNLPTATLPEWRSSEKQDERGDGDIAFPAQSSVSHFTRQQKRSLAVHLSQHLSSLCSSTITKSSVYWSILFWTGGCMESLIYLMHIFVLRLTLKDKDSVYITLRLNSYTVWMPKTILQTVI